MTELAKNLHPVAEWIGRSNGGFVLTDLAGVAVYANDRVENRTGFSVAEVVGKKPGKLWGGHMDRVFYDGLWKAIREQKPFVSDLKNRRKDGVFYKERQYIAPVPGQSGLSRYYLAVQPFHLNAQERKMFESEFNTAFSSPVSVEQHFFSWVNRWFSHDSSGKDSSSKNEGVSEVLSRALVFPLAERFADRSSDRELILLAQANPVEFRHLYTKYESLVRAYFLKHLSGEQDTAEDLLQETFYRAFQYLPEFQIMNASYGTYLLRVAHNLLVNHYRKKQVISLCDGGAELEQVSHTDKAFLFVETDVFGSKLLRETERRVLGMKYREGFSVREIATMLGKSENAVKLHLSRGRKKLRKVFGETEKN